MPGVRHVETGVAGNGQRATAILVILHLVMCWLFYSAHPRACLYGPPRHGVQICCGQICRSPQSQSYLRCWGLTPYRLLSNSNYLGVYTYFIENAENLLSRCPALRCSDTLIMRACACLSSLQDNGPLIRIIIILLNLQKY